MFNLENSKLRLKNKAKLIAERKGFEPLIPLTVYTLSKRAPSYFLGKLPTITLRNLQVTINFYNKEN